MLPLTLASPGSKVVIVKVGGNAETKKHLEDMGFVGGSVVEVISASGGNLILNVKETRVAVSRELAMKIMVNTES